MIIKTVTQNCDVDGDPANENLKRIRLLKHKSWTLSPSSSDFLTSSRASFLAISSSTSTLLARKSVLLRMSSITSSSLVEQFLRSSNSAWPMVPLATVLVTASMSSRTEVRRSHRSASLPLDVSFVMQTGVGGMVVVGALEEV